MLKENGKQKPQKKVRNIKCQNCGTKFKSTEDNTEKIRGITIYVCPNCGQEIKK